MATRGEMHSERIACSGRTYFFNVKENRTGDLFIEIVESKPTEANTFDRRSVVVFRDDLRDFLGAFDRTLSYVEKQGGKKRRKPEETLEAPKKRVLKTRSKKEEAATDESGPLIPKKKRVVVKKPE
jgi:hypothetical protein